MVYEYISSCSGKEGWFMSIYHLVVEGGMVYEYISSCGGKEGWFMSIYHLVVERRDGL